MKSIYLIIFILLVSIYLINIQLDEGSVKKVINKDFLNGDDSNVNDYRLVNSNYKSAWTDNPVNKNPKNHTSNIQDEHTDIGSFFNKNDYVDTTMPNSKEIIPDNCFIDGEGVFCKINNRVQNIPLKLIKEDNRVIKNIGDDKDINTNIVSEKNISIGGCNYNVWEYGDEKTLNGGKYFGNVEGYSNIDNALPLSTINYKDNKYAL